MSLLILSGAEVQQIASRMSPEELQSIMAVVFKRISLGSGIASPPRISLTAANHTSLFMPSRIVGIATSIKIVSAPLSPTDTRGLPASTMVLDDDTGAVKAIVNARSLTALRTAAGSVLATRLLGPPNPLHLLVFGAGKQIEAHVDLLSKTFPSLKTCTIFNRSNNERLRLLLSFLSEKITNIQFTAVSTSGESLSLDRSDVRHWVIGADIICTATSSTEPLFPSAWVKRGAHINLVGSYQPAMQEIDTDLIRRATNVVVDSRHACAAEAGELINAKLEQGDMVELGELVSIGDNGEILPVADKIQRLKEGEVTIFKSVGLGAQDVAIAHSLLLKAEEMGVGSKITSYDNQY